MRTLYGRPSQPKRRRGAILIVILLCFLVAASMFALLARHSVAEHRAAETQLWTVQSQWIAEAAIERAAARLAADANYTGDTWTISAAELGGNDGGQARIRVEKIDGSSNRRTVRVEADYPDDPVHRARWTKQIAIDVKTPPTNKAAKKP